MIRDMLCLEEVESTNLYCKENIEQLGNGAVVYTVNQTAGRGRLGRKWLNCAGSGLYYSHVIKREIVCPSALPLAVCIAVEDALERMYGISGQIKWPNDILLSSRKLVGVLCEKVGDAYIIGIGINLTQPTEFFEANNLPYATSIFAETGEAPRDIGALALAISESLSAVVNCFAVEGFSPLRGEYRARCVNLLHNVRCGNVQGTAIDIDLDGSLVVETENGETTHFTGEVSVEGIYGEA